LSALLATEATTDDQDLLAVLLENAQDLLQAGSTADAERTLRQAVLQPLGARDG
jgi:hypothetical protein